MVVICSVYEYYLDRLFVCIVLFDSIYCETSIFYPWVPSVVLRYKILSTTVVFINLN